MKAAYINEVGPPENIIFGDLPKPQPKGSEVLVKVAAVDVNPIDTYIRAGAVAMPIPIPFIVGCDLAGTSSRRSGRKRAGSSRAIASGDRTKACSAGRARSPSTRPSMRRGSIRCPTA